VELILVLLGACFSRPGSPLLAASMTVDGSRKFQSIDGFGVNAISKTWQGGTLRPGLDLLVDMGATLWRVDVNNGHSDWEQTNDDGDPFNYNWSYYNALYGGPQFADLWQELAYLNGKGITNIELSMSGLLPTWMGGPSGGIISAGMEDEFAEEAASIVYYARNTAHIQFKYFSPLNESDKGQVTPEGPWVQPAQFVRLFHKVADRLDALGMSDVQLVGPHTFSCDANYTTGLLNDAVIMAHMSAMTYHTYGIAFESGSCLGFSAPTIQQSPYPSTHLWIGEWN
jgi:O-glycosyl hydrolase